MRKFTCHLGISIDFNLYYIAICPLGCRPFVDNYYLSSDGKLWENHRIPIYFYSRRKAITTIRLAKIKYFYEYNANHHNDQKYIKFCSKINKRKQKHVVRT